MTTTTRYDSANNHSGHNLRRLRSTDPLPRWPAFSVQPEVSSGFLPVRQHSSITAFGLAAPRATTWWRRSRISVQPFDDAAVEGLGLCLRTRQSAIELDDAGAFIKEDLPVLRRPAVATGSQHSYDLCFVPRQYLQDGGGWRRGCLQQQILTVDFEENTGRASPLHSLGLAHIRPLQPRFLHLDHTTSLAD